MIFSSSEAKALCELIGWDSEPAYVCPFTLSDMNISETSRPIIIKFHLKHHWGGGLVAIGFGPDRIRTLVSMLFILACNKDSYKSLDGFRNLARSDPGLQS